MASKAARCSHGSTHCRRCRQSWRGTLAACAISKQNLCEWRAGGFAEWQARQETLAQARELAADANEITAATDGRLTDHLATVLAVRYASRVARLERRGDG